MDATERLTHIFNTRRLWKADRAFAPWVDEFVIPKLNDNSNPQELATEIAYRLRTDGWFIPGGDWDAVPWDAEAIDEIVWMFETAETVDDFNGALGLLYDFGDRNRVIVRQER